MWFEYYVWCDLKLMFVTIPMFFSTIAKIIRCCDKLWFLGVSIVTRRDLQWSIVIHLNLVIYCKSWWYTLQTYLRLDSVWTFKKKDGFLRLIVFTIMKIMSTDKEIANPFLTFENIWHDLNYKNANNFLGFKTPKKYEYGIPQFFRSRCSKKMWFHFKLRQAICTLLWNDCVNQR